MKTEDQRSCGLKQRPTGLKRKGQLCVTHKFIHHVLQEFIIIIFPGKLHFYHSHMHPCIENVFFLAFQALPIIKKQQASAESIANIKVFDCNALQVKK